MRDSVELLKSNTAKGIAYFGSPVSWNGKNLKAMVSTRIVETALPDGAIDEEETFLFNFARAQVSGMKTGDKIRYNETDYWIYRFPSMTDNEVSAQCRTRRPDEQAPAAPQVR